MFSNLSLSLLAFAWEKAQLWEVLAARFHAQGCSRLWSSSQAIKNNTCQSLKLKTNFDISRIKPVTWKREPRKRKRKRIEVDHQFKWHFFVSCKTLFKPEEFENTCFWFSCRRKTIGKRSFSKTMTSWQSRDIPELTRESNWPVIVLSSSGEAEDAEHLKRFQN